MWKFAFGEQYIAEVFGLNIHTRRCYIVGYLSNVKLFPVVNFLKLYEHFPQNWQQAPSRAAWKTGISIFINILEASAFVLSCCFWKKKHIGTKITLEQNIPLLGEIRKTSPTIAKLIEGQAAQLCHQGRLWFRPLLCLLWPPGWLLWPLGYKISLLSSLIDLKLFTYYWNQC